MYVYLHSLEVNLVQGLVTPLHTSHHILFQVTHEVVRHGDTELDAIQLSVFSHRFMSIAEQMGRYIYVLHLILILFTLKLLISICKCTYVDYNVLH